MFHSSAEQMPDFHSVAEFRYLGVDSIQLTTVENMSCSFFDNIKIPFLVIFKRDWGICSITKSLKNNNDSSFKQAAVRSP